MKSPGKNILIIAISILLLALICFQFFWVWMAYKGEQINYREKTEDMIYEVSKTIGKNDSAVSLLLIALEYDKGGKQVPIDIQTKLNDHIENAIAKTQKQQNLRNNDFFYGILRNQHIVNAEYPCTDCPAKLIITNKPEIINVTRGQMRAKHFCLSCILEPGMREKERTNSHYYEMGFYFRNVSGFVLGQMMPLIIASFICIVLLISGFIIISKRYFREVQLAEFRNDFINALTHELQTPVFTITLASGLIKGKLTMSGSNPEVLQYVSLIEGQTKHIKRQSEKILELNSLESNETKLKFSSVELTTLINENFNSLQLLVLRAGGTIEYESNVNKPIHILADTIHIVNILHSLIDNSAKYCDRPPKIVIQVMETTNEVFLKIQDNGIGVSKKHLKFIFRKFYRVPGVKKERGFGLGLSYVENVVRLHKGKIEIESDLQNGTIVLIRLPKMK